MNVNEGVVHQPWTPERESFGEGREVAFGEPIAATKIQELTVTTDSL